MSFANPSAWLWAAIAVPIVIFYILKIRMRRVPVSTVMFWEQVFEQRQPRSIWQTLRHLLSLLLQLLFVGLIILALLDPIPGDVDRTGRRLVLVIDNSASMQATDIVPSRFEAARSTARDLIRTLRPGDDMAILAAGGEPTVVCGLTDHQRTLEKKLALLQATDAPTRVREAATTAKRLLANHERGQVIVLSDGGFADAESLAADRQVVWKTFGTVTGNVGITRFQVRRSLLDPVGFEILVQVSNLSDGEVTCHLDLMLEEDPLDVIPLTLAAGEKWSRVLSKTSVDGGILKAKIDSVDALATDNVVQAILPARRRIPVVLVTKGNLFLQRVLEANELVDLTVTEAVPESLPAASILILHGATPQQIPEGNVLVIQPTGATDLWESGEVIAQPVVATQDESSELMAHVNLQNVLLPEAMRVKPRGRHQVLVASAEEEPLLLTFERAAGNVVLLSVNLEKGDLPLRTVFPILMTNILAWFMDGKGELSEALSTGVVAAVKLSPELSAGSGAANNGELILESPDGSRRRVADGRETLVGPLNSAGVWNLRRSRNSSLDGQVDQERPGATQLLACNLTNPRESDLRVNAGLQPAQPLTSPGFAGRPVWFYVVLFACLLIVSEWILFQRRLIS